MTGWKTKVGGWGSVAWGLAGFFMGVHGIDDAANSVVAGISILGLGHKIEKLNKG